MHCFQEIVTLTLASLRFSDKKLDHDLLIFSILDRIILQPLHYGSEARQPGLRLQRSCEDWRCNLPCIYQTESGIWGLHFNQKPASYVMELFHTNCLEGSLMQRLCKLSKQHGACVSHLSSAENSSSCSVFLNSLCATKEMANPFVPCQLSLCPELHNVVCCVQLIFFF
ncbi:uncharacterized protein LOC124691664 isoform X1 [Lolium rigidum]|uniref:uncharacterized protein LOC124691664 isoform X1 n=1 Tax=Lolium rigidum TaxID=89674 RepID=UPI001F5D72AB|nr:uncharacterized protein LOC124691664 isoform X1 [Lolium rigidum]